MAPIGPQLLVSHANQPFGHRYIHVCMCVCMCLNMNVCMCMYVCMLSDIENVLNLLNFNMSMCRNSLWNNVFPVRLYTVCNKICFNQMCCCCCCCIFFESCCVLVLFICLGDRGIYSCLCTFVIFMDTNIMRVNVRMNVTLTHTLRHVNCRRQHGEEN